METSTPQPVVDAVRLATVDPVGSTAVLVQACRDHLDLTSCPGAAALVEMDEDASLGVIHRKVSALADELGLEPLDGASAQEAAVAAQCRRHLEGTVTARELTYWVWRVVGLRGTERTRPFMSLEDEYTQFAAYDCSAIDADVTTAAQAFLQPAPVATKKRWSFGRR